MVDGLLNTAVSPGTGPAAGLVGAAAIEEVVLGYGVAAGGTWTLTQSIPAALEEVGAMFSIGINAGKNGVESAEPEGGSDIIELSDKNIKHIKKHTFDGMAEQSKYLTDEQLANKLKNTSFFNKDWSQDEIVRYTQEAYNTLRRQGKTGLQSIEINGEIIYVFIKEDGTFDTAYGVYKYILDDFR